MKIIAEWPDLIQREICDESLLNLAIRARMKGDKLALWLSDMQELIILFDGEVGHTRDDYMLLNGTTVAPFASLVIDLRKPSMKGEEIAGVVLSCVHHTLSYYYQARWGGEYEKRARAFNRRRARLMDTRFVWDLHTQMNFAWFENCESNKELWTLYKVFNYMVSEQLGDVALPHIPLIVELRETISLQ